MPVKSAYNPCAHLNQGVLLVGTAFSKRMSKYNFKKSR